MCSSDLRIWLSDVSASALDSGWWLDVSGHDNHAFGFNPDSRPSWVTNQAAGHPVVRFDGVHDSLAFLEPLSGLDQGEVWALVRSSPGNGLWTFGTSPPGSLHPDPDGFIRDDFGTAAPPGPFPSPVPPGAFHLFRVLSSSNEWSAWINGMLVTRKTPGNPTFPSTPPHLGVNGAGVFFGGDIAELILFDRPLTPGDVAGNLDYFRRKFGVFAPAPPASNFIAHAVGPDRVLLAWSSPFPGQLGQFQLERQSGSGPFEVIQTVVNTASFEDPNLLPDTQYVYRLKVLSIGGESTPVSVSIRSLAPDTGSLAGGIQHWFANDLLPPEASSPWPDVSGFGRHAVRAGAVSSPVSSASPATGSASSLDTFDSLQDRKSTRLNSSH